MVQREAKLLYLRVVVNESGSVEELDLLVCAYVVGYYSSVVYN
jgi:hypothetical protein